MTHWKEAEDVGGSLPSAQVHNTLKAPLFTHHMSPVGHREVCKPFKNLYYVNFKTNKRVECTCIYPPASTISDTVSRLFDHIPLPLS